MVILSKLILSYLILRGDSVIKIEKYRHKLNLTQQNLAMKLGVTQGLVSMWESGKATPPTKIIPDLAKILQCDIADLFDNAEPNRKGA